MNDTLDTFERTLLRGLRHHVETGAPAPTRRPQRRRIGLLPAGGLVATAIAAFLVAPGLGTNPAYSVEEGNAGRIEVTVNRLEDAAGLEAALRDVGVRAVVEYVADGTECARDVRVVERGGLTLSVGGEGFGIVIDPGTVRPDETLVIDAAAPREQPEGGVTAWVSAEVVAGRVAPCVPT